MRRLFMQQYQQPEKVRVRERILTKAVRALTCDRQKSAVIQPSELAALANYSLKVLRKMGRPDLQRSVRRELREWVDWQSATIGRRKAHELRVIYLCGPEPLNDLKVLLRLGVNPNNVLLAPK